MIDPRKSLAVTDEVILSVFSFTEMMNTLHDRGLMTDTDASGLFRMWWDTQNRHLDGQFDDATLAPGFHCDDSSIFRTSPFPYACPRAEGQEAELSFTSRQPAYIPIGLFNRFDLAAVDGSDCGEYRIVFARNSGRTDARNRNLIIFEGVLPNPNPQQGLIGCLPVAKFWHDLGSMTVSARAAALHTFYFDGLPGFSPIVHPDNYGAGPNGKGQIRANQFMSSLNVAQDWMLREFKMKKACASHTACTLRIVPSTVKTNPFALLFGDSHLLSASFQADFVNNQVVRLAEPDINLFNYFPPEQFNARESDEQESFSPSNYSTQASPAFKAAIGNKLQSIGSLLTPDQIIHRALALSCAGCHTIAAGSDIGAGQPSWPQSLGFTHVSEENVDNNGPDGPRFDISLALKNVFLPYRQAVLATFLENSGVPGP